MTDISIIDPDFKPFDVELIQEARVGMNGFVWARTPQGHDYWERVYDNLEVVLEVARRENARL